MHTELATHLRPTPAAANSLPLMASNDPVETPKIHSLPVKEVMRRHLDAMAAHKWESDQENAFFVCDIGEVYRQHLRWKRMLPRIAPYYGKQKALCFLRVCV